MDKVAKLQMQIKENSSELTDFLQDLTRWEENIKQEDQELRTSRRIDEQLPPIRKGKKSKPLIKDSNKDEETKASEKLKKEKIKSYDYDAWSKFDVDAACAEVESNEEGDEDEDTEDEEDEEEIERIEEERKTQQAAMEKDKGNQFFKEGKYEAAINRYTTAINLHPTNPIFYANRGMALLKMERYGAAEQDCSFALELDPSYTKASLRRGTARIKLKKFNNAKEDFQNVLKEEPDNKQALGEIKNIELLIQSEVKKGENKATITKTKTKEELTKKVEKPTRNKRSTKPLKRIFIQEIGDSDEDNKKGTQESDLKKPKDNPKKIIEAEINKSKNKRVPDLHDPAPQFEISKLNIPTTSFMFESQFKLLKNNQEHLYSYLKMIPCDQYTKLFRQCIDNLISSFLQTLQTCYKRDKLPVHEELDNFSKVERFTMATMFLSSKDKNAIAEMIAYIQSTEYPCKITEQRIVEIRKKYG